MHVCNRMSQIAICQKCVRFGIPTLFCVTSTLKIIADWTPRCRQVLRIWPDAWPTILQCILTLNIVSLQVRFLVLEYYPLTPGILHHSLVLMFINCRWKSFFIHLINNADFMEDMFAYCSSHFSFLNYLRHLDEIYYWNLHEKFFQYLCFVENRVFAVQQKAGNLCYFY